MAKPATRNPVKRSEDAVLDQALQQLLRATKVAAKKKGQPLDRTQLRKEGFSERFIDKVESV